MRFVPVILMIYVALAGWWPVSVVSQRALGRPSETPRFEQGGGLHFDKSQSPDGRQTETG
jgi:hypothetical protein